MAHRLALWQSVKTVQAGEIVEIQPQGCMVKLEDGQTGYFAFQPHMRRKPVLGDYWVIHSEEDHHETISPKWAFENGYRLHRPAS